MIRRASRGLLPEEEQLWHRVAQTATPMHKTRPVLLDHRPVVTVEPPRPNPARLRVEPFHLGEAATATAQRHDLVPSLSDHLANTPVKMDRKSFDRMSRGKLSPEGRIDLHGMTLAQAHPALNRFILDAHADGKRLVLVITGKGKRGDDAGPIPQRHGVLKHQVPQWLMMPPLGAMVLQIAEAHLKHGGTGAYYVYLRRQR